MQIMPVIPQNIEMKAYYLLHEYHSSEDDRDPCDQRCLGCGQCDHFPVQYAVSGYGQIVKRIDYVCSACYNKMDKQVKPISDVYDRIQICKENRCNLCLSLITDNESHMIIRYYVAALCNICGQNKKTYMHRCYYGNDYERYICNQCHCEFLINCDNVVCDKPFP